tara:strand:+ start:11534 stop:12460 length:927 start_codon:yes stop_codon:yes gene_type:complete
MDKDDSAKLNAYSEIEKILAANVPVYKNDSFTIKAIDIFKDYLYKLRRLIEIKDAPHAWLQDQKKKRKANLLLNTLPMINAMVRYANYKHDSQLRSEVNMTKSNLYYINEINLITFVRLLIARAQRTLNAPAYIAVDPDCIISLEQSLNDFESKRSQLKMYLVDKRKAGSEFNKNKQVLNVYLKEKLDFFIEGYREMAPAFVNHYFAARAIGKPIYRHIDVLAYVTDEATGEPIPYGKVSIEELRLSTKVTAKGHFRFLTLPEGEVVLKIENYGYETLWLPIRRYAVEPVKLQIKMTALPLPKDSTQL